MTISRRKFLGSVLLPIAAVAFFPAKALAAVLSIPAAFKLRAFLRHAPELIITWITKGRPQVSEASIRSDYERARFTEAGGYFLSEGEAVNLSLRKRAP